MLGFYLLSIATIYYMILTMFALSFAVEMKESIDKATTLFLRLSAVALISMLSGLVLLVNE